MSRRTSKKTQPKVEEQETQQEVVYLEKEQAEVTGKKEKPAIDKTSSEYRGYGEAFDKCFGDKINIDMLESISRKLDNKFQVLVDFTRESEASNCDILLFKNVAMINNPIEITERFGGFTE